MKPSFGFSLIEFTKPELAFDLEQLSRELYEEGTIDEIAIELEVIGSGNATEIRTAALVAYGRALRKANTNILIVARDAFFADEWIMIWGVLACVRESLIALNDNDARPEQAILVAEGYIARREPSSRLAPNARLCNRAADDAFDGLWSAAVEACGAAEVAIWSLMGVAGIGAYPDNRFQNARLACRRAMAALSTYGDPAPGEAEVSSRLVDVFAASLPGMPVRVR